MNNVGQRVWGAVQAELGDLGGAEDFTRVTLRLIVIDLCAQRAVCSAVHIAPQTRFR